MGSRLFREVKSSLLAEACKERLGKLQRRLLQERVEPESPRPCTSLT